MRWRRAQVAAGDDARGGSAWAAGGLGTGLGAAWGQGQGTACRPVSSASAPQLLASRRRAARTPCLLIHRAGGGRRVSWAGTGRSGEVQKDPALNFRLRVSERLDAMPLGQCLVRLEKMGLGLADALLFIRGNSSFVRIGVSLRKATRDLPQGSLLRLV